MDAFPEWLFPSVETNIRKEFGRARHIRTHLQMRNYENLSIFGGRQPENGIHYVDKIEKCFIIKSFKCKITKVNNVQPFIINILCTPYWYARCAVSHCSYISYFKICWFSDFRIFDGNDNNNISILLSKRHKICIFCSEYVFPSRQNNIFLWNSSYARQILTTQNLQFKQIKKTTPCVKWLNSPFQQHQHQLTSSKS